MLKVSCLAILFAVAAPAGPPRSDSPFSKRQLSTRVKMTAQRNNCTGNDVLQLGGVKVETHSSTVQMTGTDKAGKPWIVIATTDQCTFWQADLDGDGTSDFIFARASGTQVLDLLIVLFDAEGRAVPWMIAGHFERDENGIVELLDVNGDHHAELIVTEWIPCGKPDCWVTNAYQARAGYWHKLQELGGKTFPIGARFPDHADYSNVFSDAGNLVRYNPRTADTCHTFRLPEADDRVDAIDSCHDWVILDTNRACPAAPIIIFDRKDGRYIGRSRLLAIARVGSKVRMAGRSRSANGCEPLYMWISEP